MRNAGKLTEGAILIALFTVLLFITMYVPVIGSFINFVLPLPFIMFSAKNNLQYIVAFFAAAILISFIATSLVGVGMMLIYGVTGVVIGYLLQKNKSRTAILIASSLTFLAGLIVFYIISAFFFHFNFIHELSTILKQSTQMSEQIMKGYSNQEQLALIKKQNESLMKVIQNLAPSILILVAIISVFIIQWVCFPIVKRFGIKVQQWGSFRNLSLPKSLLWYYFIALALNLFLRPSEGTYLYMVIANAIYLLEIFLLLQGIAFLFFLFHQRSISKGFHVLVIILAFMIPIFHYIIMILGITDLGFDFRKRFERKE